MNIWIAAHRGFFVIGCAVVPVVVAAVLALFGDALARPGAALVLVLVVVGAASAGIRPGAIVAALTAAGGFDYFLTAPYRTLRISDPGDIQVAVLLLLVGVAVSELALWGRRQQAGASREQGYLDGVLGTAAAVAAGGADTGELVGLVAANIKNVLQVDDCHFSAQPRSDLPQLDTDGTLTRAGRTVDVGRVGLPVDNHVALPIRDRGAVHGAFVLTAATRVVRPTRDQLRIAAAMANQVAGLLADDSRLPHRGPIS